MDNGMGADYGRGRQAGGRGEGRKIGAIITA